VIGELVDANRPVSVPLIVERVAATTPAIRGRLSAYLESIAGELGVHDDIAEELADLVRRDAARRYQMQLLEELVSEVGHIVGEPGLGISLDRGASPIAAALVALAPRFKAAFDVDLTSEVGGTFEAWTLDDMLNLEPPSWVVEGVVPLGGRVLLFALSGSHKTNLSVDIACHVGHGRAWHGMPVAKHPVVVVATEDAPGTAMRTAGVHLHHGMPSGRVVVVPGGELRLNNPASIAKLKATAERHFPGERTGFIVDHYDVSVDGDPTATEVAVAAAAGLRELGNGAAFVLLLAHAPWTTDQRAKVPVALWANVDARLRCERDEVSGEATLTVQHQKNGRSGAVFRFEFEAYEFETRQGLAEVLIARRLEDSSEEPARAGPKLGNNEQMVLDSLDAALSDASRDVPAARDVPLGTKGVTLEEWAAAAERYLPQPTKFRKNEAVKRSIGSLVRRRIVRHVDGWVWRAR
jgi:hypothetical protein